MIKRLVLIILVFVSSCNISYSGKNKQINIYSLENRKQLIKKLASENKFKEILIDAPNFKIYSQSKVLDKTKPTNVYLEGDGFAFENVNKISKNPTPIDPVAMTMATEDKTGNNVIYIARPCQYTFDSRCDNKYWSTARFSKEVIISIDFSISYLLEKNGILNEKINLIGYSGGGAVATIIGSIRKDVASIRTVAGNLDHNMVNNFHKVTPLYESLNPAFIADKISNIPQIHFTSQKDDIVPSFIAGAFAKDVGNNACVRVFELEKPTHYSGWSENWNKLVMLEPTCNYGVSFLQKKDDVRN
jgi:hypothetical protein